MSVEPCPNCGSTEKTPEGLCAKCGRVPDRTGALMRQIYAITGGQFMSIFIYGAMAAALTQGAAHRPAPAQPGPLPELLAGLGAVLTVASVVAAFWVPKADGPKAVMDRVMIAVALAQGPAIIGLVSTILTMKLVWMAWGLGFALAAFLALAFQMPAIAARLQDWNRRQ